MVCPISGADYCLYCKSNAAYSWIMQATQVHCLCNLIYHCQPEVADLLLHEELKIQIYRYNSWQTHYPFHTIWSSQNAWSISIFLLAIKFSVPLVEFTNPSSGFLYQHTLHTATVTEKLKLITNTSIILDCLYKKGTFSKHSHDNLKKNLKLSYKF